MEVREERMQPKDTETEFSQEQAHEAEENQSKFILFNLNNELYGAPLLKIREVIKVGAIKPVPYMVNHFKGVINLRGQIVSVVDLRLKFNLPVDPNSNGLILVVETAHGLLGAIIDDLVSVQHFNPSEIETNPAIETKIPADFFAGVAKMQDRLVNLVDLSGCLSSEDLRVVKNVRKEAA